MHYETITFETRKRISYVCFHRPHKRNAINEEMIMELEDVIGRIEKNKNTGVLILYGSGECFVSGGDISMLQNGISSPYAFYLLHDHLTRFNTRLERLHVPVIAAVEGYALGGGLEIATACDFRITGESTLWGLPEAAIGIMPGSGGTVRLARLVGKEQALLMMLTAETISGKKAHIIGLAGKIVADGQTLTAAKLLAQQLLKQAPASIKTIKRAVHQSLDMPLEGAIEYCQFASLLLGNTEDANEGLAALLEKRLPKWQDR